VSSFTVSATAVTFLDSAADFQEQWPTLLRTWDFEAYLTLTTDYATLASLLTYPYTVRSCPGPAGVTMRVDVGGGAGFGTLVIDNHPSSPFNAILVRITRPSGYPGGGRRVRLGFQETQAP
jgi:hypothetical protein